jgi:hypothetical protein
MIKIKFLARKFLYFFSPLYTLMGKGRIRIRIRIRNTAWKSLLIFAFLVADPPLQLNPDSNRVRNTYINDDASC